MYEEQIAFNYFDEPSSEEVRSTEESNKSFMIRSVSVDKQTESLQSLIEKEKQLQSMIQKHKETLQELELERNRCL